MARAKGKSGQGKGPSFIMIPNPLFDMPEYVALGFPAKALLSEFIRQYIGTNNGDLCNAFNVLKKKGWKSEQTIRKATAELIEAGLIIHSRQGGRNKCNLYALAWKQIDDCKGKQLDIKPTNAPILKLSMRGN
jgi:hypothetical protein